ALQMSAERVQTPAWQDSAKVQALPSSQGVPSAAAGFEHTPVPMSQIPATWHWSSAVQTTGAPLVQGPDWQLSLCVQAFPSLQAVPSAAGGFEHTPVPVSQSPATWHWSSAVQTTGAPLVQVPDWQLSLWVQALPSSHACPSVSDPVPFNRIVTSCESKLPVARSGFPSPFRSPTATASGLSPTGRGEPALKAPVPSPRRIIT